MICRHHLLSRKPIVEYNVPYGISAVEVVVTLLINVGFARVISIEPNKV